MLKKCIIKEKLFRKGEKMTRAEKREIKRKMNREIAEFIKIQNHYFPDLVRDIKKVLDGRHQSYITVVRHLKLNHFH